MRSLRHGSLSVVRGPLLAGSRDGVSFRCPVSSDALGEAPIRVRWVTRPSLAPASPPRLKGAPLRKWSHVLP